MASKTAGIFKRGSTYYARFFVPSDQQARLGKEDVAWSLKTGDIREARSRLPALQEPFQALITPPDPHRLDLEAKYGIPAAMPAAEALRRLTELSRVADKVDEEHWTALRKRAAARDLTDAEIESMRQDALFGHRAGSAVFAAAAANFGLAADKILGVEDAIAALGGAHGAEGQAIYLDDILGRWAAECHPTPKTILETNSSIKLLHDLIGRLPMADITWGDGIKFKEWLLAQPGRDGKPPAAGTVQKRLSHIKTLLKHPRDSRKDGKSQPPINPWAGLSVRGFKKSSPHGSRSTMRISIGCLRQITCRNARRTDGCCFWDYTPERASTNCANCAAQIFGANRSMASGTSKSTTSMKPLTRTPISANAG